MQEVGELHQTLGESSSPDAPTDSAPSLEGPCLSSGKSKKRERPDPSTSTDIRDQFIDEYTSPQKRECIENFVDDGGGLANIAAVDQLMSKMKQEKSSSLQRSRAAKILIATTKDDCLQKFVLSGGVSILEEWIQEGSKIRYSDAGTKDDDKCLDEEMMVILQALEKLPISLETLKGCSIGKSVKQLRSVRNGEIQKRARKLVDAWRKRVDLEMKQTSTLPVVAPQLVDSVSCASDLSPGKEMESINQLVVKPGSTHSQDVNATIKAQTLVSTFSSAATLDAVSNEHSKTAISPEKDASKKTARLSVSSSTSASSFSPAKKQKHSSLDKDFKDEGLNLLDCLKLKEKDLKCDNSNSHAATDTAVKKTNEYRKKLRSGGSSTAPCSTDSHAITSPSNGVQTRGNNDEKVACIDRNMSELEQQHVELPNGSLDMKCANTPTGNEAPDPFGRSEKNAGNKDEVATNSHPQDGKMDLVNESCLSSQSSCTDKQPKVVFMVEKTTSQMSPLQDAVSHLLSPKVEPNPSSASMANAISERKESTNGTCVREFGVLDREESCCSHNTQQNGHVGAAAATQHDENAQQKPTEYSPIRLAEHEGACMLDGATCSESPKFVVDSCQDPQKNDASNIALTPSLAADGNSASNVTSELDKAHVRASEIPAVTHSCHDFDLNEGLAMDEFMQDTRPSCDPPSTSTSCLPVKVTGTLSAPIAVSAATKGAFIPPLNAPCKSDIGWRGSAATSAFRPAEPRHASAKTQPIQASSITEARIVNCFDLNVADQEILEDCPSLFGQGRQQFPLDLNYDGREIQARSSFSDSATHLRAGSPGKLPEKRALLDFDLNEQLNEAPQEQEVVSSSAARSYGGPISFGGLSGHAACGEVALWTSAEGTSYQGGSANGPRFELFSSGYASQPAVSSRQVTPTSIVPPPVSSVVYSQTAPFFGGPTLAPFPASFTYNPMSVGPDTSYMVSKAMPGTAASSVGVRSRAEITGRPAFLTSIDDLRGGNNVYTWGRAPQSMYGNSGPTIISYNDAAMGAREHVVGYDGNVSLEEQMRLFQQAAVPVSSLKRRDAEYFPGLKQTSWH